jgi:flavin reductase (DIM6/NTAB) family NADH-FMN oxidoreductase RutF
MHVDMSTLAPLESERLINGIVVPRPIAWITSVDSAGRGNLAPFSYFNVVSGGTIPVVMVSFSSHGEKHSLANLAETGEFVVNVVSDELREAMVASSADVPAGTDEARLLGLATTSSTAVRPPRLADARAALECRTSDTLRIDDFTIAFGRVVHVYISDAVIRDGRVDPQLLAPVGRLGGSLYTTVSTIHRMPRPSSLPPAGGA